MAVASGFVVPAAIGGIAQPSWAAPGFEIIRTVAGGGALVGTAADGQPATDAAISAPWGVEPDGSGGFYFSEGEVIRRVNSAGVISTVAGTGARGFSGDGGPATAAQLANPRGLGRDSSGDLYFADFGNFRVRKISTSGVITTVAGNGVLGFGGDGGPALAAKLRPYGVHVDATGNIFIADGGNSSIRRVDTSGIITTVAGKADSSFSGDGGPATSAALNEPKDVFVDAVGNIIIPDHNNNRIRRVDATSGIITTIAGTGVEGSTGDGGPALSAQLNHPSGIDVDADGTIYFSEERSGRVRKVDSSGIVSAVAGGGTGGDNVPPLEASLAFPVGVASDPNWGVLIVDGVSNRVRQVVTVPDLLGVTMSDSPDPVNVDQVVTFVVSVVNNGTDPASGVTVTDALSSRVKFASAVASQGSCSRARATVTCNLGTLAPGAVGTATIAATARKTGYLENTATASADEPDPFTPNNSAMTRTAIGGRGCGQVLTSNTRLTGSIGPCPADGVVIGSDGITLNLAGYQIFGFPGRGDGTAAGIRLPGRSGVAIRNGTVSGFDAGVVIVGGGGNQVSRMTIRDNLGPDDVFTAELGDGIFVQDSAANTIADNLLTNNGVFDGIGVFGSVSDDNIIRNNTVLRTLGPSDGGPAGQGIIVNGAEGIAGQFITGTQVVDNVVQQNGSGGLANISSIDGVIRGNLVEDNGLRNSNGNGIGVQIGQQDPVTQVNLLITENEVHRNGWDGIQLSFRVQGNQVLNNRATESGRRFPSLAGTFWVDLRDRNANCGTNVWSGNVWGTAYFNPPCVTAGGSGPTPPPAPATAPAGPEARAEEMPPSRRLSPG